MVPVPRTVPLAPAAVYARGPRPSPLPSPSGPVSPLFPLARSAPSARARARRRRTVVRGEVELAEEAASDAQMQRREARENKAMHKKNAGNAGVNPALARGRSTDIVLEDI